MRSTIQTQLRTRDFMFYTSMSHTYVCTHIRITSGFVWLVWFVETGSHSWDWPWTPDPPTSALQVLELQTCSATPFSRLQIFIFKMLFTLKTYAHTGKEFNLSWNQFCHLKIMGKKNWRGGIFSMTNHVFFKYPFSDYQVLSTTGLIAQNKTSYSCQRNFKSWHRKGYCLSFMSFKCLYQKSFTLFFKHASKRIQSKILSQASPGLLEYTSRA